MEDRLAMGGGRREIKGYGACDIGHRGVWNWANRHVALGKWVCGYVALGKWECGNGKMDMWHWAKKCAKRRVALGKWVCGIGQMGVWHEERGAWH